MHSSKSTRPVPNVSEEIAATHPRQLRWAAIVPASIIALAGVCFLGVWLYTFRPLPPLPQPTGRVTAWSAAEWSHLPADEERCFLVNNMWNRGAAGVHFAQEIFDENLAGSRAVGWRWRSPWQASPSIVSYPEMICGNKPWDQPMGAFPGLPMHPAANPEATTGPRHLTVDYNIRLRATGVYNLAFSLWAVSNLPPSPATIHCEIMIWIANSGQKPAGTLRGTVNVQGTPYDVWINEHQHDNSGANKNEWTYVAYVARSPVLNGPLDLTAFVIDLEQRKILTPAQWITDLELGNEVAEGAGITEIQNFALHLE